MIAAIIVAILAGLGAAVVVAVVVGLVTATVADAVISTDEGLGVVWLGAAVGLAAGALTFLATGAAVFGALT